MTDRKGITHGYSYDACGRLDSDEIVKSMARDFDASVMRISYGYDEMSQLSTVTSRTGGTQTLPGRIRSKVTRHFTDMGQILSDQQQHSPSEKPTFVSYRYANTPVSVRTEREHVRLQHFRYPDGRWIHYRYQKFGLKDWDVGLNRITGISSGPSLFPSHDNEWLARYEYFGLGNLFSTEYSTPGINQTLSNSGDPARPDFGNLDQFGRHKKILFDGTDDPLAVRYGYHHGGRKKHSTFLGSVAGSTSLPSADGVDEAYAYDDLGRLNDFARGSLKSDQSGIVEATKKLEQTWQYDATDNWKRFEHAEKGKSPVKQTRQHDRANQITSISGGWVKPEYDANGNMTVAPDPLDPKVPLQCTYDGWNRLTLVKRAGKPVARLEYDGLGRRIVKHTYATNGTEERHYYYNDAWQVVEERVKEAGKSISETAPDRQYVWGLNGPNDLILREGKFDADGKPTERLYAAQDVNGNVIGLFTPEGEAVELMRYDAYGKPTFYGDAKSSESDYNWNYLYGGYHYDPELGLYDVRRRVYHPTLGRWLQQDPSGYTDSYNLYQYALSDPIDFIDPDGEVVIIGGILIAAGVGALLGGISYGVEVATTDREFTAGGLATYVGIGALSGAAAGLTGGLAAGAGAWVAGAAAAGAGGLVQGAIHGGIEGGWQGAAQGAAIGLASGLAGGAVGGAILGRGSAGLGRFLLSSTLGGGAGGATAGGLGAAFAGEDILSGAASGAFFGAAIGGTVGYLGHTGTRFAAVAPQVIKNVRVRSIANRLGIRTDYTQKSLRTRDTVSFFKERMRSSKRPGDWDVETGDGIAMSHTNGKRAFGEGNHRMRAALEIMLETGDDRFVREVMARAFITEPSRLGSRPFVSLPLEYPSSFTQQLARPLLAPTWVPQTR